MPCLSYIIFILSLTPFLSLFIHIYIKIIADSIWRFFVVEKWTHFWIFPLNAIISACEWISQIFIFFSSLLHLCLLNKTGIPKTFWVLFILINSFVLRSTVRSSIIILGWSRIMICSDWIYLRFGYLIRLNIFSILWLYWNWVDGFSFF